MGDLEMDLKQYIDTKMITIIKQTLLGNKINALAAPLELIRKNKIKRVVIDSLTMFSYLQCNDEKEYRKEIIKFLQNMNDFSR